MTALGARLSRARGQIAPISAMGIFGLSFSMSLPLLALLLERMGESGLAIGVSTTVGALMMVVAAPVLPRLTARLGLGPLVIGSGLILAALMIAFPLLPDYWWWLLLRLIHGAAGTALFFAAEYWIVAVAPAARRGRVIAAYTMALSGSFMLGPYLVGQIGVSGFTPFIVGALILLAGLVPTVWGLAAMPPRAAEAPPHPRATLNFFVSDPALLWGVVLFGLIEYGAVALLPVWAVRSGFDEAEAATIMASFAAGSILLQPLLGWAADRYDRRLMLGLAALASVLAPLAIIPLSASFAGVILCVAFWGGMAVALYALALTELGARYSGLRLAEGNAAVVLAYGIGALVSPTALGLAMDWIPPNGLLWSSALAALGYGTLIAIRIGAKR